MTLRLHATIFACVVAPTALGGCKPEDAVPPRAPATTPTITLPTAAPAPTASAPVPTAPVSTTASAREVFTSVVVGAPEQAVELFPVGSRALIAVGHGFWGYAAAGRSYVQDANIVRGLPSGGPSRPQAVGGLFPDIAVSHGEREFIHYAGAPPVLFPAKQGGLAPSKVVMPNVPRAIATSKGVTYAFVASPSYFRDGTDPARCGKTALTDQPVIAVRGDQKLPTPRAPIAFFPQGVATDASGQGFVFGADVCLPGAFIASLDASPWKLERVPTSEACTERMNTEGMPFTHARLFPSASGGLYVLLVNAQAWREDDAPQRTGACAAPARVLERSKAGTWTAPRTLADVKASVEWVDPAGTAWAITEHGTIWRIPVTGEPTELGLAPSCATPHTSSGKLSIRQNAFLDGRVKIAVPFPDQPWITVEYNGERVGLCAATLP